MMLALNSFELSFGMFIIEVFQSIAKQLCLVSSPYSSYYPSGISSSQG